MFKDKSGMFNDFGFKLIVINTLLEEGASFTKELEEMKEKYVDNYDGDGYECIPEMVNYFENLVLTKEDLEKVEILYFDGGNEIYFYLMEYWDGESGEFDMKNVEGYKLLTNLKEVNYVSMCAPSLMDTFEEAGIEVS